MTLYRQSLAKRSVWHIVEDDDPRIAICGNIHPSRLVEEGLTFIPAVYAFGVCRRCELISRKRVEE